MLFRHPIAALPIAATLFAGPSFAQVIVVTAPAPAFAAVAYDYTDAIPLHSSIAGARATLRHAGAVCRDRGAARMTCAGTAFGTDRDQWVDITWTVDVDHQADAVTGLGVARPPTGA